MIQRVCVFIVLVGSSSLPSQLALAQSPVISQNATKPQVVSVEKTTTQPKRGVIVVRPRSWSGSLSNWKSHRESQGYAIHEIDSVKDREQLRKTIREAVTQAATSADVDKHIGSIVLVGDAPRGEAKIAYVQPTLRKPSPAEVNGEWIAIPTWYRTSTAMVKFGCDLQVATDTPYADLNDDDVPDLAIGRIPADDPASLEKYLSRVVAYERLSDFGSWRRDVRVVAGVGGFGALADSVIEMTTRRFLTDRVPLWADVCMTYASPNSPYCPDPLKFSEATVDQMNAGSLFWVYVGHGHVRHLDFFQVEKNWLCILSDAQVPTVKASQRPPIAVFLACYTGAFDAQEDCIAEQLILHDGGPVAAIAATRVTGPYGLSTLASGVLEECYVKQTESLGEMFLHAKQHILTAWPDASQLASGTSDPPIDPQMQLITSIASALSPQGHDLLQERKEHVWQMNLLGDPLLRIRHPQEIEIDAIDATIANTEIELNGSVPHAGKLTFQLTRRRDRAPAGLFVAGEFSTKPDVREKMHASYAAANSRIVMECTEDVNQPGQFRCKLKVPENTAPGRYDVRAFLAGEGSWAAGHTTLQVKRPAR